MATAEELKKQLGYEKKSFFETADDAEKEAALRYAEGYRDFIDCAKTERESVDWAVKAAEREGYRPYRWGDKLAAGGRYYLNNRGKSLYLFRVGTESPENGIRIIASHIDSPRLDLKPVPLYEESGMAFLKTHYYGGIRKYQWTAIPLALHGAVVLRNGETVRVRIGDSEDDPVFYINDLLPHLASEQDLKPLGKAISGESLNLLSGSAPVEKGTESDEIKLNLLRLLNERCGIKEDDFLSAELCAVPAFKARDVGLDRWLLAAYGHDDHVCAYPSLTALFAAGDGKRSLCCILADKEETGSNGNTGMQSRILSDLIDEIAAATGTDANLIRANSECLSADVAAAYDPNFPEVYEKKNAALLSRGVAVCKYTGARGKIGTNDASAEFTAKIRALLDREGVNWQLAELGKIDAGGGGTVAKFISVHNIDTIDIGVPVLSMHAPYEVISKADLYSAHRALSAFFTD